MTALRILVSEVLPHPDLPLVVREAITWGSVILIAAVWLAIIMLAGAK